MKQLELALEPFGWCTRCRKRVRPGLRSLLDGRINPEFHWRKNSEVSSSPCTDGEYATEEPPDTSWAAIVRQFPEIARRG